MIITLKGADFSQSNIGTLSTYSIRFNSNGITNANTSVDRETNTGYTATITFKENYELNGTIAVTMGGVDITSTAVSGLNINITKVTGNVVITVPAKSTVVEPEEPVTPTNYTFTINPTPTSATVTLTATGYSTVSGTGNQSITVANGTTVSYSVSASGYTTQSGTWTANENKTLSITLVSSGGSGDGTLTELTFTTQGFYNNSSEGGGITSPNASWRMSDLIPINTLTNGSNGYCTTMLQGHSRVAVVYYASSNSTDKAAFLGNYGTTTQSETAQYTAEEIKSNAPEGTTYVGFSTHSSQSPLIVYVLQ